MAWQDLDGRSADGLRRIHKHGHVGGAALELASHAHARASTDREAPRRQGSQRRVCVHIVRVCGVCQGVAVGERRGPLKLYGINEPALCPVRGPVYCERSYFILTTYAAL